jgi:tetratricopeptide (TPR) repeat protein
MNQVRAKLGIGILTLFTISIPTCAAEPWIKLATAHFELYTDAGEQSGRDAILWFEQLRGFFVEVTPFGRKLDAPVRIIAFRSEEEYRPYRTNESSAAFFARDADRDYIVMQDLEPAHYFFAVHEYTHLTISRSGLPIPLWMNEGWADLNSTLQPKGRKSMIGGVLPGRRELLLESPWIPLSDLEKVDQRSPMYNERSKATVFYAESWAFMHMLFLSPPYMKNFDPFVQSIIAGNGIAKSCRNVLGKSAPEVQADLERYLKRGKMNGALFEVKLQPAAEAPSVSRLSTFDSSILFASLLAMAHKYAEAAAALGELARQYPAQADVEESLGYLALRTHDRAAAIDHFQQAIKDGPRHASMCLRLALLLRDASPDRAPVILALKRALELDPDYGDDRLQLGIALLETRDFAESLKQLQQLRKVSEENAPWFFAATAFDDAHLGRTIEARKNVELARKWAKTDPQKDQVAKILRYLDERKAAP